MTPFDSAALAARLLDVIEHDVVPLTRREIGRGNKIFGAAILRKSDLSVVIAETNNEVENPLWHGEMHALKRLYERPHDTLPDPRDCLFLATHEPCSLCLSAITWAGYDNFFYLFSHEDSRDSFAIPHDIRILKEVFRPPDTPPEAPLYNRRNSFWEARSIADLLGEAGADAEPLKEQVARLSATYAELSALYQESKGRHGIPLP